MNKRKRKNQRKLYKVFSKKERIKEWKTVIQTKKKDRKQPQQIKTHKERNNKKRQT
jgi:hypothetical protein